MFRNIKKLSIVALFFLPIKSFSQNQFSDYVDWAKEHQNEIRIENIENQLNQYGKEQHIANKITVVTIATIVIGTIVGVPAEPLVIVNSIADLTTLIVTYRANKKLQKSK